MIRNEKKARRNGHILLATVLTLTGAAGFAWRAVENAVNTNLYKSIPYAASVQTAKRESPLKQEKKLETLVNDPIHTRPEHAIWAGQLATTNSIANPTAEKKYALERKCENAERIDFEKPTHNYSEFVNNMQNYVDNFESQNLLQKDALYMSQAYSNFSTSDMINIVRCVYKEAGARKWSEDEKQRKLENLQDIVPILASIVNRWITSQYDPVFKNDFNGPGEITFSKILNKKRFKQWNDNKGKAHSLTTYQFSAMMDSAERAKIKAACETNNLFHGIKNPYDIEKTMLIYEAAKIVLPELAKNPDQKLITLNNFNAELPVGYFVLYKTIGTDHKVWHDVTIKGRTRKNTGTFGNHRYYTVVDAETGKNLIRESRIDYANSIRDRMPQ